MNIPNSITKTTLLYFLTGFVSLPLFFSSAAAAALCTPVVYAFRHAEDQGRDLTEVGERHANLYPSMLWCFGAAHNYCPVGYVYSMYNINADGQPGTNNPLQTAEPLANVACYTRAIFFNDSPDTQCSASGSEPSMALVNGRNLYEHLGATTVEKKANSATGPQLLKELIKRAPAGGGLSSAIFWTSQGLHDLGEAIAPGTDIPVKTDTYSPPRNAAYVFVFNRTRFEPIAQKDINQYVQCFNVHLAHPPSAELVGPGGTMYYCGNGDYGTGNLPSALNDKTADAQKGLDMLKGMICDTFNLTSTGTAGYYGYCQ
jgi:hypothetical protein